MKPSVASIIQATAVQFNVAPERIVQPDGCRGQRKPEFVRPRHVAMYLARELSTTPGHRRNPERTRVSLATLGRIFGRRDHTTVLYAHRAIPKLAEHDSELAAKIKQIRESLEVA